MSTTTNVFMDKQEKYYVDVPLLSGSMLCLRLSVSIRDKYGNSSTLVPKQ